MTDLTKTWTERFAPPQKSHLRNEKPKIVWPTSFPELLKLSSKERKLNERACITYKRLLTLSQQLTRYKILAQEPQKGSSGPCGHCSLCGNYGKHASMIEYTESIRSPSGRKFLLLLELTCADYGVYVATCLICANQYVGQTYKSFTTRWNSHRATWKKGDVGGTAEDKTFGDKAALRLHYFKHHHEEKRRELSSAFKVVFVDRPTSLSRLDLLESQWISRLKAKININKTVLPKIT